MQKKSHLGTIALAGFLSTAGFLSATIGVMYIAGMFGLSISFASQIVSAVEVGGIALAIVMGLLSGGTAGIIVATTRAAVAAWGKKVAIA